MNIRRNLHIIIPSALGVILLSGVMTFLVASPQPRENTVSIQVPTENTNKATQEAPKEALKDGQYVEVLINGKPTKVSLNELLAEEHRKEKKTGIKSKRNQAIDDVIWRQKMEQSR